MRRYGILVAPSANRVYADVAPRMLRSEVGVFAGSILRAAVHEVNDVVLGGVPYLELVADELDADDIAALSNLSAVYALFEITGGLLRPVELRSLDVFASDLITVQKYAGKTNEQFTKLLLNVTAVSTDSPGDFLRRPLRVLDPMCGRGTTLNQAMMYGFDAHGVDVDGKDFEAYAHFVRTWLKNHRLKHTAGIAPLRRNREMLGKRLEISYGVTKERYRAGEVRVVDFVNADTLRSREVFGREAFDILVTDTPYGVQHGSTRDASLARSPLELLRRAVPVWAELIRPGGAVGLSWNTHVGDRGAIAAILGGAGLDVLDSPAYLGFEHRVDQAIVRDLIVARKPAA